MHAFRRVGRDGGLSLGSSPWRREESEVMGVRGRSVRCRNGQHARTRTQMAVSVHSSLTAPASALPCAGYVLSIQPSLDVVENPHPTIVT